MLRLARLHAGFGRLSLSTIQNVNVPTYLSIFSVTRSYCEGAEEEYAPGEDTPEGEEWMMVRQAKKTSKKRLEAKRKSATAWRNIAFQAWTHMYRPEHAKYMLKSVKEQAKYDDIVLTPKHGERFMRVYNARRIQDHNHARKNKVFPFRR